MNNYNEENINTQAEETQPWLMTYADMMTLLFAFFVLLYSMSSPDPVKMAAMEDAIAKEAGIEGELKSQNEIKEELEEIIKAMDLKDEATVIKDPRGVAIELDGDICFESASTQIQNKLEKVLNNVATELLMSERDFRMVIVEGHTDSQKIPKELKNFWKTALIVQWGKMFLKYFTVWAVIKARTQYFVRRHCALRKNG